MTRVGLTLFAVAFSAVSWGAEALAQSNLRRQAPVARTQTFGGICQECDLSYRAIPGVHIDRGDFSRARFVKAFLAHMNASGSTFVGADFTSAVLSDARFADSRSDGAKFAGADMYRVDASRATLSGAVFSNAVLDDAVFVQARLNDSLFAGVRAPRVNFLRADLRNAYFAGAQLQHADFTQADVRGALFSGANLSGADLSTARGLSTAQLKDACGNSETRLPAGVRLQVCE